MRIQNRLCGYSCFKLHQINRGTFLGHPVHTDAGIHAFLVLLPLKHCGIAALIWYVIKQLFHEYLCPITV